jgi:hypothetical protein
VIDTAVPTSERQFIVDDVARVKTKTFARAMVEDVFAINKISRNILNATRCESSYEGESK